MMAGTSARAYALAFTVWCTKAARTAPYDGLPERILSSAPHCARVKIAGRGALRVAAAIVIVLDDVDRLTDGSRTAESDESVCTARSAARDWGFTTASSRSLGTRPLGLDTRTCTASTSPIASASVPPRAPIASALPAFGPWPPSIRPAVQAAQGQPPPCSRCQGDQPESILVRTE